MVKFLISSLLLMCSVFMNAQRDVIIHSKGRWGTLVESNTYAFYVEKSYLYAGYLGFNLYGKCDCEKGNKTKYTYFARNVQEGELYEFKVSDTLSYLVTKDSSFFKLPTNKFNEIFGTTFQLEERKKLKNLAYKAIKRNGFIAIQIHWGKFDPIELKTIDLDRKKEFDNFISHCKARCEK